MHFGFIAVPLRSHFTAMTALARVSQARGHFVTFFHQADAAAYLVETSVAFHSVGQESHPVGCLAHSVKRAANPLGLLGLKAVIADMACTTEMLCRTLPAALQTCKVDALVVDQMEPAGGIVAQALRLPFISVACALPINRQSNLPLPVMPFRLEGSERFLNLYAQSTRVYDWMMRPVSVVIEREAQRFGLPALQRMDECLSPLAHISQTTVDFDFPRVAGPVPLHHVGPLRENDGSGGQRPTTKGKRDRPVIFASLGTLQGHRYSLFKKIAFACHAINADLLVAHCGCLPDEQVRQLERIGNTKVVSFADQLRVIADADAVVTHAGLNTVMDAIACGTPVVALPLAFDQAGVAARVEHAHVGYRAFPDWISARRLGALLSAVMVDVSVHDGLARQAAGVKEAGGVLRAADIILAALAAGVADQHDDVARYA